MLPSQTANPPIPEKSQSATGKYVAPAYYPNGDPNAPYNPPGARYTDSCLPLHATGEVTHNYATNSPAPGDIAFRWIHGSPSARPRNTDPRISKVLAYNEDSYILRENPCIHWEAPFTYLLFGNTGAVLTDTGATPEADYYPLRKAVDAIIRRWCDIRRRKNIPLTVVLTSGEDIAQNQGLQQFTGRPDTALAPAHEAISDEGALQARLLMAQQHNNHRSRWPHARRHPHSRHT